MHMHTHSLPEIGRSSSWRLLEAEPRTRCGWDWWAPVPLRPSRLWPKAGTKDSMALTSSHPHPLVEPKGILRKMGKEIENNTPGISHPHPADQGDPSGELAYSLVGARSSGPAWHSQDRIDENCLQKMPLFVCLLPLFFLLDILLQLSGKAHFAASLFLCLVWSQSGETRLFL